MQNDDLYKLELVSDLKELTRLEFFLEEFFLFHKIHKETFKKVYLCVSEAVMNSISHGNKFDKNKKIYIVIKYFNNIISVKVRDEGEGFNFNNILNPTDKEYIKCESGRGIFIIRSFADKCCFNSIGNELKLNFVVYE